MKSTNDILDPLVVSMISECPGGRVFDYGCGYTDQIWKIRDMGYVVLGYDISEDYVQIQKKKNPKKGISFITHSEFQNRADELANSFDIVNCSIVLCSIRSESEVRSVVKNMNMLLKLHGCAIISICNPLSVFKKESDVQRRRVPHNVFYDDMFCYKKEMKYTGNIREDFHRPIGFYEKLFHNSGFKIERIEQSEVDRFGSSDFMTFKLKKIKEAIY